MIHSESNPKNDYSQWFFPDEYLYAQAGNTLISAPQTPELYLLTVIYIIQ